MAMKNWVLEVGNTRCKLASFRQGAALTENPTEVLFWATDNVESESIPPQFLHQHISEGDKVMLTGSGDLRPWLKWIEPDWTLKPGDATPLPTDVTPAIGLGLDRVANAWAVLQGCLPEVDPEEAWMVVDVGTCMTMDVVCDGRHLGGTISPGMQMRLRTMGASTANLPILHEVSLSHPPSILGRNTEEAMVIGARTGLANEITGMWHQLRQELSTVGLILTGGDVQHLELRDIQPKFADASLTLKGYHALFQHASNTL